MSCLTVFCHISSVTLRMRDEPYVLGGLASPAAVLPLSEAGLELRDEHYPFRGYAFPFTSLSYFLGGHIIGDAQNMFRKYVLPFNIRPHIQEELQKMGR